MGLVHGAPLVVQYRQETLTDISELIRLVRNAGLQVGPLL